MKIKITLCFLLISLLTIAQISSEEIDKLVERTLTSFNVPGIAVAIVKDGKVIHAKGYGVKSILTNDKVNENTLFRNCATTSKMA